MAVRYEKRTDYTPYSQVAVPRAAAQIAVSLLFLKNSTPLEKAIWIAAPLIGDEAAKRGAQSGASSARAR